MSVPEIESVQVGARRIAWRRLGEGPPLVMVNGYAATSADWDPTLLALLADSHDIPDMPMQPRPISATSGPLAPSLLRRMP